MKLAVTDRSGRGASSQEPPSGWGLQDGAEKSISKYTISWQQIPFQYISIFHKHTSIEEAICCSLDILDVVWQPQRWLGRHLAS